MNQELTTITLFLNNDTIARKSFDITIKDLINQHPTIFKHITAKQGIQLVDESKRDEAVNILKKHYKQPKLKINDLTSINEINNIIHDSNMEIKEKIKKIHELQPTFTESQISAYLYRIGAHKESSKTTNNSKFTDEIINIIENPKLITADKLSQIKLIDSSITKQSIYNYIQTHNIPTYKPFTLIKDELIKQKLPFTNENITKIATDLEIPNQYWNDKRKISNFINRNK
jgi:hypothetical protein